MVQYPLKDAAIAASVSIGSAGTSFFVATLPVVQWLAGAVAIISGIIAILLGVTKLRQWRKLR